MTDLSEQDMDHRTERTPSAHPAPGQQPPASFEDGPEARRSTAAWHLRDLLSVAGAAVAAVALTFLLFGWIAPFDAPVGFVVVAYLLFLGVYAVLVSFDENAVAVRDRVVAVLWQSLATLLLVVLVFVIGYTLWRGHRALVHTNFFTHDLSTTGPLQPLTQGGVVHAILGTLEQITIALAVTVPLGLACAVFLNEVPGGYARLVRTVVEAMTALPSIVAGLFIYATVILVLGWDKSGLAAGLALSLMMLPIIIRASDVVIRLVPGSLREASYALGASHWRTVLTVVLPTARSGLTTAVILGTARGIGETSPVLLTAGYTASVNKSPLSGPQTSLPLATFFMVASPQKNMIARGFGAAALLMALVLLLFAVARIIGGRGPGELSRGQQRRRAQASRRDLARMTGRAPGRQPDPAPGTLRARAERSTTGPRGRRRPPRPQQAGGDPHGRRRWPGGSARP
ncbi:MAG: phosphate ABC transporter permease PstA [Actinomycetia bacterium]|nr:phosphate ABC transporter permease PstA [Actinomycetes bacterium]